MWWNGTGKKKEFLKKECDALRSVMAATLSPSSEGTACHMRHATTHASCQKATSDKAVEEQHRRRTNCHNEQSCLSFPLPHFLSSTTPKQLMH
jgi:hypothetical protein